MNSSFRLRISILSGFVVFFSFTFFFIIEYFFWLNNFSNSIDSNFYIGRVFISISFSFLSGLIVYIYTNNFYESLRAFAHKVQIWGSTLEMPKDSGIQIKADEEILSLEKFFIQAIETNKLREKEIVLRGLEKNNASIVENLKPYLPELKLEGMDFLEVSVFPSSTNNIDYDFLSAIETEKGYIIILCGFEKTEVLESIYKVKMKGICSALSSVFYLKEDEILLRLENILKENSHPNLRLSVHYIPNTANHISSIHFQKMPLIELSDSGITLIRSDEIFVSNLQSLKFHKSIFMTKSYLVILSDKVHERLSIPINDLISILEKEVFSRPIFNNSKELLYQISVLLERIALSKNISGILESLYLIIVFKK